MLIVKSFNIIWFIPYINPIDSKVIANGKYYIDMYYKYCNVPEHIFISADLNKLLISMSYMFINTYNIFDNTINTTASTSYKNI